MCTKLKNIPAPGKFSLFLIEQTKYHIKINEINSFYNYYGNKIKYVIVS